jgi:hypothetical protein
MLHCALDLERSGACATVRAVDIHIAQPGEGRAISHHSANPDEGTIVMEEAKHK